MTRCFQKEPTPRAVLRSFYTPDYKAYFVTSTIILAANQQLQDHYHLDNGRKYSVASTRTSRFQFSGFSAHVDLKKTFQESW